jgi:hypothetical protein
VAGALGYDEAAAVYVSAPKGFALLLAIETVVSVALIFPDDFHWPGWIIGGVAASVTAVSYRAHERAVRKRAGTKYVPSRTISRLVAALLLVSIAAGTIHAFSIGSERKLKPVGQDQS